jgi:hypothetical protein
LQTRCAPTLALAFSPPTPQEGDFVVMVQEYADGGDLFNLLQKYGGRLSERVTVSLVLEPFLRVLQVRARGGRCLLLGAAPEAASTRPSGAVARCWAET